MMKVLLKANASINTADQHGNTATFFAAQEGQAQALAFLITAKADVNATTTQFQYTPTIVAAESGRALAVGLLVAGKADVERRALNRETALFKAASHGHIDTVQVLLFDANANVDVFEDSQGRTPVAVTAKNGDIATLSILISAKADVNIRTFGDSTPLSIAIEKGNVGVMNLLVTAKANINAQCFGFSDQTTPLLYAVESRNIAAVQLLLNAKAEVDKTTDRDPETTPLCLAARQGLPAVLNLLIKAKADINKGNPVRNAVMPEYRVNSSGALGVLIAAKANIDKPYGRDGTTPAFVAAQRGNTTLVSNLSQAKADMNRPAHSGTTPTAILAAAAAVRRLHPQKKTRK